MLLPHIGLNRAKLTELYSCQWPLTEATANKMDRYQRVSIRQKWWYEGGTEQHSFGKEAYTYQCQGVTSLFPRLVEAERQ